MITWSPPLVPTRDITLNSIISTLYKQEYVDLYEDGMSSTHHAYSQILDYIGVESYRKMAHIFYQLALRRLLYYYPELDVNLLSQPIHYILTSLGEPLNPIGNIQTVYDCISVIKNASRPQLTKETLILILECSIEGYTLYPDSKGKRDAFDYWLLIVLPQCVP